MGTIKEDSRRGHETQWDGMDTSRSNANERTADEDGADGLLCGKRTDLNIRDETERFESWH